jgi:hypothetical protein
LNGEPKQFFWEETKKLREPKLEESKLREPELKEPKENLKRT